MVRTKSPRLCHDRSRRVCLGVPAAPIRSGRSARRLSGISFTAAEVILHGQAGGPTVFRTRGVAGQASSYFPRTGRFEGLFFETCRSPATYLGLLAKVRSRFCSCPEREAEVSARPVSNTQCCAPTGNEHKFVELSGGNQQEGGDCQIAGGRIRT